MEVINFIKYKNKKYIGNIDNSFLDKDNHNYFYYNSLLKILKQNEFIIFNIIDDKLKIINQSDNYLIDNEKLYYTNKNINVEFYYKIKIINNTLKISFYLNEIKNYIYFNMISLNFFISNNFINKIIIINNLEFEHPYANNFFKNLHFYLEYMPELNEIIFNDCFIYYGYTPKLKNKIF